MDSFQIEKTIDFIVCDKIVTEQFNGNLLIELILYNPSPLDKKKSFLIYDKAYKQAIEDGLLTEEELKMFYIENGLWSIEKEIRIETIKDDIHKMLKGLLSLLFHVNKLKMAKVMLRTAEKELRNLLTQKMFLLKHSAEDYALSQRQKYILSRIVYNNNGERFWKSDDDFNNEQNVILINRLCSLFFDESRLSSKTIKEIARSNQWKTIWCVSKNSGNLFEISPVRWTDNQKDLAYWSYAYDMVMEAYERPSKDIIIDDDLLDSWLINQHDKIEEKCRGNKVDTLKTKKGGRQEVFVFSDKEGSKNVYELNDSLTRSKLKAKQKAINSKGVVEDRDMPDSQIEMMEQLASQIKTKMGDVRKGK